MRGYGQFCPVGKARGRFFAERWTLIIVRELVSGGRRFNDIRRGVPLISPSLLSKRLDELCAAGVIRRVKRAHAEYELTAAGEELRPIVELMGVWGQKHVRTKFGPDDLDASLLMWDLRRTVDPTKFPPGRWVLQFLFKDGLPKKRSFWLINEEATADLCLTDPGFDVDLLIRSDLASLTRVWIGDLPLERAIASGAVQLDGHRELSRRFRAWLQLSPFAAVMPAA